MEKSGGRKGPGLFLFFLARGRDEGWLARDSMFSSCVLLLLLYVLEGVRGMGDVSLLATWIDMDGIG